MSPLSVFPQLLTFGLFAPTLLRLVVGIYGMYATKTRWKKPYKLVAILNFAVSLLVILGLYTQPAVIAGMALLAMDYYFDKTTGTERTPCVVYMLMFVILLSLLFTGPGLAAFDLPL